ncbi:MAG: thiamine-phosphate kinase [Steroidobacteraceae bacterium]
MTGGVQSLGEFELIDRYFARSTGAAANRPDVILGVGDDAAVLRLPPNTDLVAAVDTLVAGRHFPVDSDPRSIGHRALAVNLSDIAAMGATPAWATLALTMPCADASWLEGFSAGLMQLADAHGVALVGGDTTAGPLTISIQILGYVERGSALRRSGAHAGDILAVTGTLGDAGAGLALLTARLTTCDRAVADELIQRFEYPAPRVSFGSSARGIASAAMDLSDGLVGDLPKLSVASGVAAHVDVGRLPLSSALRALVPAAEARELALAAGDDYELLVAVPPRRLDDLAAVARQLNLTLTPIGELRPGNGVTWAFEGRPYAALAQGYDHFR